MPMPGCAFCVRFCSALQDWPAAVLCVSLSVLQMAVLDYYLIHHLGISHLTWLAFDAVNITLQIISIHQARTAIHQSRKGSHVKDSAGGSMGWASWLLMSISVACKSVVIFHYFSDDLDESASFFGPNTLKTTIALGSCTFLLLLITQHDAPAGSDGRRYIEELTGTVVFDILDTVDILEVLFDSDERDDLWDGMEEFIMAVAVLNMILPTVPLFTLAKSKFGQKKLSIKFIQGHRILLVLAVNMPNLLIRLLLWHGLSAGVSPFTLKNILAISLTFYDIYEHNKEELEDVEENKVEDHKHKSQSKYERESGQDCASGFKAPRPSFNGNGSPPRSGSPVATDSGVGSPAPAPNAFSSGHRRREGRGSRTRDNYSGHARRSRREDSETMSSEVSDVDERGGYSSKSPAHINTTSV